MLGATMGRYLRLILLFARLSIQNDAAYRLDFLVRIVTAILHLGAELVGLWVVFSNTRALNGWGVWETLTLLGVWRVVVGSIRIFVAPNMRQTMEDIRQGTLDYVLLRPLNHQFLASFRRIVVIELFDVALGLSIASFAVFRLLGRVPVERLATFLLMLGAAVMIVYSIWLVLATSAFWFTRLANIEMIFWNVFEVGRYPIAIYPPWLRWMLTFILPVAFITSVPAQSFFGQVQIGPLIAGLILAPAMLIGASLFWRYGVRHYSGASA